MQFQIQQAALLSALNIAGKCINANAVVPALSNYLFDLNHEKLKITGSNMEIFITTSIDVVSKFTGKIIVPAQRVAGLVKDLPQVELKCELKTKEKEGFTLTIKAGKGVYNIPCDSGDDYPEMKQDDGIKFQVPASDFTEGVKKALTAVDRNCLREELIGVLIQFDKESITFTGCDKFILSTYSYELKTDSVKQYTVPPKVMSFIGGMPVDEFITLTLTDKNITIDLNDSTKLQSVLVNSKYPDYKSIIPVKNNKIAKVNREQLIQSLRRVGSFADLAINAINFNITDDGISLTSRNDFEESAFEELPCVLKGDPISIWLKGDQVLPVLLKFSGDDVFLHLSEANNSVLFKADDSGSEDKKNLMLVVPVNMVNN